MLSQLGAFGTEAEDHYTIFGIRAWLVEGHSNDKSMRQVLFKSTMDDEGCDELVSSRLFADLCWTYSLEDRSRAKDPDLCGYYLRKPLERLPEAPHPRSASSHERYGAFPPGLDGDGQYGDELVWFDRSPVIQVCGRRMLARMLAAVHGVTEGPIWTMSSGGAFRSDSHELCVLRENLHGGMGSGNSILDCRGDGPREDDVGPQHTLGRDDQAARGQHPTYGDQDGERWEDQVRTFAYRSYRTTPPRPLSCRVDDTWTLDDIRTWLPSAIQWQEVGSLGVLRLRRQAIGFCYIADDWTVPCGWQLECGEIPYRRRLPACIEEWRCAYFDTTPEKAAVCLAEHFLKHEGISDRTNDMLSRDEDPWVVVRGGSL